MGVFSCYVQFAEPTALWRFRASLNELALLFGKAGRIALVPLALLYPAQVVLAVDPDAQIDAFIAAEGFTPFDPDYFWSEDWSGPHRFPDYDREGLILQADNGLSDAEKAILAIEALEQPFTHVRYKITSTDVHDQDSMATYRFFEITRFNLGPTLFEDVQQAYQGVFTPSAENLQTRAAPELIESMRVPKSDRF